MNYKEINFNKKNRRPVTDTTYQIDANEWNALGAEVDRIGAIQLTGNIITDDAWDENEYPDVPTCDDSDSDSDECCCPTPIPNAYIEELFDDEEEAMV